jgi:phosphate transport system permease protein
VKDRSVLCFFAAISFILPGIFIIILVHVILQSIPAATELGTLLFDSSGVWRPLGQTPSFSILPIVLTTLYVAALSVAIAAPIGGLSAIFLNYYAGRRLTKLVLVFVDLLAGVPSVIYGFIGLVVVVRNLERIFSMSAGESVLAASLVLSVMLLPYIISTYSESIEKAKNKYDTASLALGVSAEYSVLKVIIPVTKRGAAAAVISAFGRASGETIAVMMVIGNAPIFPRLLGRGQTISGLTALEIGSAEIGSIHISSIYAANLILLMILAFVLLITYFLRRKLLSEYDKI